MDTKTTGWRTAAVELYVLAALIALVFFIRSVYKTYRAGEHHEATPIKQMMIAVVLLIVGLGGNNLNSLPMWIYIITPSCGHYALLITYFVQDQVFNNRLRPIIRSKIFFITTILSIISACVGLYSGNIKVSFINEEPFLATPAFYIYNGLVSFISLYLEIINIIVVSKSLYKYRDLSQVFRRYADIFMFLSFVVTSLSIEVNIVADIIYGGIYRHQINNVFFSGIAAAGILVPLVVMPQEILTKMLYPVQQYKHRREKENMTYLYNKITQVIKCVQYRPDKLQEKRMLIELEQAHYILWTHEPKVKPIKPRDTANYLFNCLQNDIEYSKVGPCIPPTTCYDMDRYLVILAKQLRKLERRSPLRTKQPPLEQTRLQRREELQ
jgi:hypothetical protein